MSSKPAAINPDGSVFIGQGEMTDDFKANLRRQESGLPPAGASDIQAPVIPGEILPFVQVAHAAVGKHVADLKTSLAHIERELSIPPFGANGSPNPYLVERQNGLRETADRMRSEIAAVAAWSDHKMQVWAKEHGAR